MVGGTASNLKKALIEVLDGRGSKKSEIPVLFNPSEYSLDRGNQFQNVASPGLSAPITQFINGNAETLTMELFFDTYEKQTDVRDYTDKIDKLLNIDKDLHAPPVCKFVWGSLQFKAVLEKVTKKFSMFLSDGTPVRAKLNVSFKEYKTYSELIKNPPRQSSDRTKRRILKEGETLWSLAAMEYHDPGEWRHIAKANGITNPRTVPPGTEITIPPLE